MHFRYSKQARFYKILDFSKPIFNVDTWNVKELLSLISIFIMQQPFYQKLILVYFWLYISLH